MSSITNEPETEQASKPEAPSEAQPDARPESKDPGSAKPAFYRRPRFLLGAAIVAVVALVFGVRAWLHARSHESTDDAFVDAHVIQITPQVSANVVAVNVKDNQIVKKGDVLVELDRRDLQTKLEQAQASLHEAETRESAARSNVDLIRKSSRASVIEAQSSVDAARSNVTGARGAAQTAQGRADQASATVRTAEANVAQARAGVVAAQAEVTRAVADVKRYQQLFDLDEVSKQQFDKAEADARTAEAELDAAKAKVNAAETAVAEARASASAAQGSVREAQSGVGAAQAHVGEASGKLIEANTAPQRVAVSESQAATAGATIEQARAAVAQAELMLSYTKVVAPEDGRVTMKVVETGQLAQIGEPMMVLVTNDIWVTANFKETSLDEIRPGQPVVISLDAYPDRTFRGHVDSIQSGSGAAFSLLPPENATGNFVKVVQRVPVKIVFDEAPDPQLALGPGMSAVPEVTVR